MSSIRFPPFLVVTILFLFEIVYSQYQMLLHIFLNQRLHRNLDGFMNFPGS